MNLNGHTILVTGGNAGIGKAIASRLAADGASVGICARSEVSLAEAAAEIEAAGGHVVIQPCDVSDRDSVEAFVSKVVDRFGSIDGLVNNAGTSGTTPLENSRHDALWDTILRVNLDGPYFMTASVLPHMPDGGRIVNISSILGRFGVPGYAAYCTSKHGLIGLTRTAALELSGRRITVNAICPGWVDTAMARQGMEAGAQVSGTSYVDFRSRALAEVPLGQIIDPMEVAGLVAFLLGPDAANITGQAYNICGGQAMN